MSTNPYKVCTRCDRLLPLERFSLKRNNKDGRQSWCKDCYRDYSKERRESSRRRYREDPIYREQVKEANRENYDRDYQRQYGRKLRKDPERRLLANAQRRVAYYVKKGAIPHISTRICADCGEKAEVYHHEDYHKPLDIIPLCLLCNRRRRRDAKKVFQEG